MTETVTIPAKKVMWGITEKARLYKIGEDEVWIPNSLCSFNDSINQGDPLVGNGDIKGELTVVKWYYDKKIKK